jgi:hypothetical protein
LIKLGHRGLNTDSTHCFSYLSWVETLVPECGVGDLGPCGFAGAGVK